VSVARTAGAGGGFHPGVERPRDVPGSEAPARPAPDAGAARMARALGDEAAAYSFFQAVRLLGRLHPDRAPVGEWASPGDEVVRFAASTSLGFPTSEIESLTLPPGEDGDPVDRPARMVVSFFGLTGPQSVLPHVYTEHAAARAAVRDTAFRDFLDLFHHRLLSLFYRAWEQARFAVAAEAGRDDRLFEHLLDLAGLGTAAHRRRLPIPDEMLAFNAGVLALRSRPADGLAGLIADHFGVPASIEQFVGEWRQIDWTGQCTLGTDDDAACLGLGVIGDAAWDPHARVRLRLGPLTRAQYDAFLPGGAEHETLRALATFYADAQVGVDAQLVLAGHEVAPCVLDTGSGGAARASPLGRGTWLVSRPPPRDPDETVLPLC
jgi:type VI secretion system protein ImpH